MIAAALLWAVFVATEATQIDVDVFTLPGCVPCAIWKRDESPKMSGCRLRFVSDRKTIRDTGVSSVPAFRLRSRWTGCEATVEGYRAAAELIRLVEERL